MCLGLIEDQSTENDGSNGQSGVQATPDIPTIKIVNGTHKMIGEGSFSKVFEYNFNGEQVAVKRIQIPDLNADLDREPYAMNKLNHPNVLTLIDEQEDENFKCVINLFLSIKQTNMN